MKFKVLATYSVTRIECVDADTAEEAAERVDFPGLCNQCTDECELDDTVPFAVKVYDEAGAVAYEDPEPCRGVNVTRPRHDLFDGDGEIGDTESARDAIAKGVDGCLRIRIGTPLAEVERALIQFTLEHTDGNKNRAAELLGIDRVTLYRKLKANGLESA